MKFEGTRPSRVDQDVPVYVFAMGIEELKLILGTMISLEKRLPDRSIINMPMNNRAKTIIKVMTRVLCEYKHQSGKEICGKSTWAKNM